MVGFARPLRVFPGQRLTIQSSDGIPRALRRRLLVDVVRVREESAGHPQESAAADAAATAAGGDLAQRLDARAHALPDAPLLQAAIAAVIAAGRTVWIVAAVLGLLLGWGAGSAILSAQPINLPLTLTGLVGLNLMLLLVWILFAFSPLGWLLYRAFLWLVEHPISQHLARTAQTVAGRPTPGPRDSNAATSTAHVLRVVAAEGRARWLIGSAMHTAWLFFALACALTIWICLLFRSYTFSWETTLLNRESLEGVAHTLSWLPAQLGLVDSRSLSVTDTVSTGAHQSWGWWLVWTTIIYGALPRALALVTCVAMFWRSARNIARDFDRPGFARLRTRLMPASTVQAVSDPDNAGTRQVASMQAPTATLHGAVHGLGLDGAAVYGVPSFEGVTWTWLGHVDNPTAEAAVVQRLRNEKVATLAVVVRAAMSPDRGVERILRELKDAARAPLVIVLDDIQVLQARGLSLGSARRLHWQELATRVGAVGIVPHTSELYLCDGRA